MQKNKEGKTKIRNILFFVVSALLLILFAYYVLAPAPTQGTPLLNSTYGTNSTNENLTVYNVTTADGDSDPVQNVINWYRNNTAYIAVNMPFEGGTNNTFVQDYDGGQELNGSGQNLTYQINRGHDGFGILNFTTDGDTVANNMSYFNLTTNGVTPTVNPSFANEPFSIEAWFQTPGCNNAGNIITKCDSTANQLCNYRVLIRCGNGTIEFYTGDGTNFRVANANTDYRNTGWHHFVAVYDKKESRQYIYVDNILKDNISNTLTNLRVTSVVSVGQISPYNVFTQQFNGSLSLLRIWNDSLSTQQIQLLWDNRTNILDLRQTETGDVWNASITSVDVNASGTTKYATALTILANGVPSQGTPLLNSTLGTNLTTENLTVYNVSTVDPDGNAVKNIYNWYRNNTPIAVLNMPFEGGSNATFTKDYSSLQNNGTVNGPTWNATGGFDGNGSYNFSGTGKNNITITNALSNNITGNQITLEAWIKPQGPAGFKQIIARAAGTGSTSRQYGLYVTNTGTLGFETRTSSGTVDAAKGTINTGVWSHVVGTYDGANMRWYIDGVQVGAVAAQTGNIVNQKSDVHIGEFPTGVSKFNGTIDELRIYNISLTAGQVLAHYRNRTDTITGGSLGNETFLRVTEFWNASITPNDGTSDGVTKFSANLTLHSIPTIETPVFNVTNATFTKTSGIKANTTYRDVDTDVGSVSFAWFRNGTEVFTDNYTNIPIATIVNSTLSPTSYSKSDLINVTVYASNGGVNSSLNFSTLVLTVQNSLPTHGTPILNSSLGQNSTADNLTVYNVSTTDPDNDPVKNIYNWYRNNTAIAVLNMPFEGGSNATNTTDYSPFQNNGTVTSAVYNSSGGYDGKGAYMFNGINTDIILTNSQSLNITGTKLTLAAWVKPNGTGSIDMQIIARAAGTLAAQRQYGMYLRTNATGQSALGFDLNAGSGNTDQVNGTIQNNVWTYVAVVYNGTDMFWYIDGVLNYSTNKTGNIADKASNVFIGRFVTAGLSLFNGSIDEVQIYNISLTSAQILAHYRNKTDTIDSSMLQLGDFWNASITPNDGAADGTTKFSTNVTVNNSATGNTVPTIETPVFNVTTLTKNSGIKANTTYRDGDSNAGSIYFAWFRNGTEVFTDNYTTIPATTIVNSSLSTTLYSKSDLINVTVYANDGTVNSVTNFSTTLTVQNTAPTVETPVFNITTLTKTSGIKANTTYRDVDSDNARVSFRWFRNNSEVYTENYTNIPTATIVNSTLSTTFYSRSDLINVTVFADDVNANSTTNFSTTLTVANTAPIQGTPILNSTLRGNNTDENLTAFNVSVSDPDNDGITTYYEWFNNSRSILNTTTNIVSTGNLTGGDRWNVSVIASDLITNSSASFTNTVTINYLNVSLLTPPNASRESATNLQFNFNVTAGASVICSLFNNDTGTFRNVTSISAITQNGNNTLTHNSILENNTLVWNVECISPGGTRFRQNANFTLAVDRTLPIITFTNPTRTNTSILRTSAVLLNLSCDDAGGVFEFQVNITNATSQSMYTNLTSNIAGANFGFTPTINFSNNASGQYRLMAECSDDHTKKTIGDYKYSISKGNKYLGFEPSEAANLNMSITAVSSSLNLKDIFVEKKNDRYSFTFDWFPDAPPKRPYTMMYQINSLNTLVYRNNSGYTAHFVSGPNWLDFEGVNGTFEVYENATGWYVKVVTNETYQNFSSIGGLNQVQENVSFTYDGDFDIANTTTITSSPASIRQNDKVSFNATFNVTGITNATNLNITLTVDNAYTAGTIVTIVNGTTQQMELNWSLAENGTHTIRMNADANNIYPEAFEDNNNATITVTVMNVSVLNLSLPANNTEIIRGKDTTGLPGEDTLKKVNNLTTILARVYNRYVTNVGVNSNCTFYFNDTTFLGWNQTNTTGECSFTFDQTVFAGGIYNITANFTNLNTTNYLADTNSTLLQNTTRIDLGVVTINLAPDNDRTGGVYNPGDVAVMNITVTKNGTNFNPAQFIVEVKDPGTECNTAGGILFNHTFPGDVVQQSAGFFQSFSVLEADTDIHWCLVVNNSQGTALASASHSDKSVVNTNANRANFTVTNTSDAGDNAVFDDMNITLFSSVGNYKIFDRNFTERSFESRVITQNEKYSILFRHNARQEQLNVTGMNITAGNRSMPFNLLPTYAGALPNKFTNITTIIAFNNSGFTFTSANITVQKANLTVDKIVHCLNWDFTNGNCTGTWEINFTSEYANFGENATHLWFQVSSFTAYAGGNGSNSNLTIYDQADSQGGSVAAEAGLNVNFTANYTRTADNIALSDGGCNITFSIAPAGPSAMTFDSTRNVFNFTRVFSSTGTFTWNATCSRVSFDQLNASDTIQVVDTIPPNVSGITPIVVTSDQANLFSATVSDFVGVTSCTMYTNNVSDGSMTISGTTATRSKTFSFSGETLVEMYANCTDAAGNLNFTRTNVFIEPLRSGGGAGDGARGVVGGAATAVGFEGGTKYQGIGVGNIIGVEVNGITYLIKIIAIYPNSVRLDVGGIYNVVLLEGLFRNFDVNQNGINDVVIYVDDVVAYSKVTLTVLAKDDDAKTPAAVEKGFFDLGAIWNKVIGAEESTAAKQEGEQAPVQEQPTAQEFVSSAKQLREYLNAVFKAMKERGMMTGSAVAETMGFIATKILSSQQMKVLVLFIMLLVVLVSLIGGASVRQEAKKKYSLFEEEVNDWQKRKLLELLFFLHHFREQGWESDAIIQGGARVGWDKAVMKKYLQHIDEQFWSYHCLYRYIELGLQAGCREEIIVEKLCLSSWPKELVETYISEMKKARKDIKAKNK